MKHFRQYLTVLTLVTEVGIYVARETQLSAVDMIGWWRHFRDVVSQKSSPSSAVGVCLCSCFHFTALGRVAEWAGIFVFVMHTCFHCNAGRKTRQGKQFYWCCGDLCRWSGLAHCASSRQDDSLDPTTAGTIHLNLFIITLSVCFFIALVLRSCAKFLSLL